jgi:hypothetical protein
MRRYFLLSASCFLVLAVALSAQSKPDFSGTWLIDVARSGPQAEIWLQRRAALFKIEQTNETVIIDTGDGSLFAVPEPVTETPLVYPLDSPPVTVLDRSLGDLPNFVRKIETAAHWEGSTLVTLTTHIAETPLGRSGITRVVTFDLSSNGRELTVERTGYRGQMGSQRFLTTLPRILHRGIIEDDRVYARDKAFYARPSK